MVDNDVGQLAWVMEFPDDASFDKFWHFLLYDLQIFWGKFPFFGGPKDDRGQWKACER